MTGQLEDDPLINSGIAAKETTGIVEEFCLHTRESSLELAVVERNDPAAATEKQPHYGDILPSSMENVEDISFVDVYGKKIGRASCRERV